MTTRRYCEGYNGWTIRKFPKEFRESGPTQVSSIASPYMPPEILQAERARVDKPSESGRIDYKGDVSSCVWPCQSLRRKSPNTVPVLPYLLGRDHRVACYLGVDFLRVLKEALGHHRGYRHHTGDGLVSVARSGGMRAPRSRLLTWLAQGSRIARCSRLQTLPQGHMRTSQMRFDGPQKQFGCVSEEQAGVELD